jgi:hypothetical protein
MNVQIIPDLPCVPEKVEQQNDSGDKHSRIPGSMIPASAGCQAISLALFPHYRESHQFRQLVPVPRMGAAAFPNPT